MKHLLIIGCLGIAALGTEAETLRVGTFNYYGPYALTAPLMVDSVDVNGVAFSDASLSEAPTTLHPIGTPTSFSGVTAPGSDMPALHTLSFNFENTSYATPTVKVEGLKDYTLYVDGKKEDGGKFSLRPATHRIDLRYITNATTPSEPLKVELTADNNAGFSLRTDGKRRYTLMDVLHGTNIRNSSISPDGKYIITSYTTTREGGKSSTSYRLTSLADNRLLTETPVFMAWMPHGSTYYYAQSGPEEGKEIVTVDVASGSRKVIAKGIPEDCAFAFTPDAKSLILSTTKEGRKEDSKVYQILEPEDRQPGWRNRSQLAIFDIGSGVTRPLTFGHRNAFLNDISDDSRYLLISTSESRLEKRPTTIFSLYRLDLATMKADTLVSRDGFIGSASFSPDGSKVLLTGFPEALGGIGKNVPEGRIPSMTDTQLFVIDVKSKMATPLTREFNPSVQEVFWSRSDGKIYLTAEDRDRVSLFRIDPATGKTEELATPAEVIKGISLPLEGRNLILYGESASSPMGLYSFDSKTLHSKRLDSPKEEMLAGVQLGKCEGWDFINSRGDTINGRFYLPPDFDPKKKYPLIVNYYGGCSPTGRNFETRYPHNAYASQGYVVYVINPSGATGFGQEFSSRHVNTAGEGVAQDIIEGTKKFCAEHPYVDEKKIGCIGASYGGFMTQYLQTVTDIFAAAISHAGISDHTSYWGEGYWGYSYSEVSMAESYPWSDPDLYVKQSPLYNADKIHTPLLFLHGDQDHNVPVGESIQMFTALKLLGRPTAFVAVADQDHHILDYDKRIKWQDTIFAWFARYLKDDPAWWDALYPPTPL